MKKIIIIVVMPLLTSASLCLAQIVQPKKSLSDIVVQDSTLRSTSNSEELEAFKAAEELNMHFAYNNFINSYPNSALISEARNRLNKFKTFMPKTNTFISVKYLSNIYHWNGYKYVWSWDKEVGGMEIGGSTYAISHEANTPKRGVYFDFVEGGKFFGKVCLGNIQIQGDVLRKKTGLIFLKGSKLIYPVKVEN